MRHRKRLATRTLVTIQSDRGASSLVAVYTKKQRPCRYVDDKIVAARQSAGLK